MSNVSEMGAKNDIRNQPAYTLAEASRYLKVPTATLRSWVVGRTYPKGGKVAQFSPLIHPSREMPLQLSFWNLIEAHVLRAFRAEHGVPVKAVRQALEFAERELNIQKLLLHKDLCTHAGDVFLDKYGELINLSASGQLAIRKVFEQHLERVEWDDWQFPVRLYPFVSSDGLLPDRRIAIDANIAFGRPVLLRKGISTSIIADRIDAGETVEELAKDYDLSPAEIEEAVLYERAA